MNVTLASKGVIDLFEALKLNVLSLVFPEELLGVSSELIALLPVWLMQRSGTDVE